MDQKFPPGQSPRGSYFPSIPVNVCRKLQNRTKGVRTKGVGGKARTLAAVRDNLGHGKSFPDPQGCAQVQKRQKQPIEG